MRMNLVKTSVLAAFVLLASFATARTEPNSFLNKTVTTHAGLMAQVQTDDEVMQRFMRHFGMTRQQVIDYFSTLRIDTLKEDGVYLVYNVPESEEIRARAIFYKTGTKVFVDQNGTLVLKLSCGNPMLRGTDSRTVAMATNVTANPSPLRPVTVQGEGVPTDFTATTVPAELETSALPFPTEAPGQIVPIASVSRFNPAFLLPLAAVPFVVTNTNDPVPEPFTMVGIAAGAGLVAIKRRRRTKN